MRTQSESLFSESLKHIPGGVNSPVRAFRAVGGTPFFVQSARGARITDVDGNEYIDSVGTWGPAILGHAQPKIIAAVKAAADHGTDGRAASGVAVANGIADDGTSDRTDAGTDSALPDRLVGVAVFVCCASADQKSGAGDRDDCLVHVHFLQSLGFAPRV